jgi:glutaminyl-tRNA synthetase
MEVTLSAGKKAKAAFEKVSKRKPDPAGLLLGKQAQEIFLTKDYAKAKVLFESARELCENSEAKAAKAKQHKGPSTRVAESDSSPITSIIDETLNLEVSLPEPGSEGHLIAKQRGSWPLGAKNFAVNTSIGLSEHLKTTGGKWQTRFPPEPNGYLHIGHAKAMLFDFGVAAKFSGNTYLRFDDTNPTAERQEYVDSITDSVAWLGHEPFKITYSSDYFDSLYSLAIKLIKRGKAYVCHQSKVETAASRQLLQDFQLNCAHNNLPRYQTPLPPGSESPFRGRSVNENLRLFDEMSKGLWDEGSCSLRMKGDLRSDITSMWDLAAFRIKYKDHPHARDKYCIYPTYDYTHCLVDSLENVTHSLCTLEFETRQAPNGPYYWLLDSLGMYKPITWEFARCNITYNVLSKRKLGILVEEGHVNGWDDPRLLTLEGLRRRGYTPTSINRFCYELGITRNENTQHYSKLEQCIREELDDVADRRFGVLDPLPVMITNHPGVPLPVDCPLHPKFPERGFRTLYFTSTVFIERGDFRAVDDKNFFGLAPGKSARLLFGYNVRCTGINKGTSGEVVSLSAVYDSESLGTKPPKGTLHWASTDFVNGEVRVYNTLFSVEAPGKNTMAKSILRDPAEYQSDEDISDFGDWLSQVNPHSVILYKGALLEPSVAYSAPLSSRFQLQRLGYFTIDKDSTLANPVLNRIVTLKESKELKKLVKVKKHIQEES